MIPMLLLYWFQLWLSSNTGFTWMILRPYVKAFFWSPAPALIIERMHSDGRNTVYQIDLQNNLLKDSVTRLIGPSTVIISEVEDFQIRGDYRFATSKKIKARIKSSL